MMYKSFLNSSSKLLMYRRDAVVVPVRYFRKPKWIPMAKSKAFKNVELKKDPVVEVEEMKTLKRNMKLYSKSLWNWQKQIYLDKLEDTELKDEEESESVQLRRIIEENKRVNIRVKCLRDAELVAEWAETSLEIKKMKDLQETDDYLRLEAAKKHVLIEMERLKTAMNLEDLDEAIEQAMSSEVDYNFAIDKEGQIHRQDHRQSTNVSSSSSSFHK